MEKEKIIALNKEKILALTKFVLILGLSILAPLFKNQLITGPIVNALLYIAIVILGLSSAIFIGLLPSAVSLATGLLPIILAPMIPFIIIGNSILVIVFNYFYRKNYWLGVGMASLFKFLFLFVSSQTLVNFFLKSSLAAKAASMMSWSQLYTAIIGGIIAFIFLRFLKKV